MTNDHLVNTNNCPLRQRDYKMENPTNALVTIMIQRIVTGTIYSGQILQKVTLFGVMIARNILRIAMIICDINHNGGILANRIYIRYIEFINQIF